MLTRILCLAVVASSCAMADFVNGSFSTGDLSGWTHYLTANGRENYGDVASFDTTGTGANPAARFEIGQSSLDSSMAGAGIRQSLFLQPGTYTLTADIALLGGPLDNFSGGVFTARLDSSTLDTHDFGYALAGPAIVRSSRLMAVTIASAGTYQFSFEFTRPYLTLKDRTPYNYIDNIHLSGGPVGVPETADWTYAALAFGGVVAATRFRRG